MNKLLKQAFTLIELLVVIAIIGILSGLIVVSMDGVTQKASVARGQVFANSLRNSLMLNIVSEWNFNDTSNLGHDAWTTNDCVNVGTPVTSTDCMQGSCLSFNGTANYLSCTNNQNLQITGDQTIEMWVYPTDLTLRMNPYNKSYGGEGTITQEISGSLNYYYGTAGSDISPYQGVSSTSSLQTNKWYHLVLTRSLSTSPRTVKWFINGVPSGSQTASYAAATASINPLLIGSGYCSPYRGKIDNVRIYSAAIPNSQIRRNYYAGLNNLLINGGINTDEYLSRVKNLDNIAQK